MCPGDQSSSRGDVLSLGSSSSSSSSRRSSAGGRWGRGPVTVGGGGGGRRRRRANVLTAAGAAGGSAMVCMGGASQGTYGAYGEELGGKEPHPVVEFIGKNNIPFALLTAALVGCVLLGVDGWMDVCGLTL